MKVLLIILAALVVMRLCLPLIVLYLTNHIIKKIKGFRGKVSKVRMNLVGHTVRLQELCISKRDVGSATDTLTVSCAEIEVNFKWRALMRKEINSQVTLKNPKVVYTQISAEDKSTVHVEVAPSVAVASTSELASTLQRLTAFDIDLVVDNGSIRYINPAADPKLDIEVDELNVEVMNFSNKLSLSSTPTKIDLNACVYEGSLRSAVELRPLEKYLTFELYAELNNAKVIFLNNLFRRYAKIDVNSGTFGIAAAIVSKNGHFHGYVQPVLTDVHIVGKEDRNDSFFRKTWEHMAAIVVQLLKNKEDQIETKIPIEGRLDDARTKIFSAIAQTIKSALLGSLWQSVRKSISFRSLLRLTLLSTAGIIKKSLA